MPETMHTAAPGTTTGDPAISAMSDIANTLADLIKGYEEMVDRADDDLKPIVQRLLAIHQGHAAEVFEHFERLGGQPGEAGSLMGLVHTAVATVRDWADALDASAIEAIADGEEQIVDTYDKAIEKVADRRDYADLLVKQRDDLKVQIDALRS
ncbi:DUF2383 domain-containing protein [Gymnodinialimonas ulvae]|uniref:DUF2383 domain-containing protein n=1 Tax=Gymnodinialimonas ulvae TaxID=3126504 RepID=UPI00309DA2BE